MGSKIFKSIVERKIDNFVNTYADDSDSLFKNISGNLIHPGEYGMYREECLKELLRFIVKKDMSISDGFIITNDDEVSTQCDIIIYNADVNTLVDNNIAKFFPMEIVNGIGEVKSDLNITDFKKALRKLAKNKMYFSKRDFDKYKGELTRHEYNYPVTFLVCKRLNFDLSSLSNMERIYEGIPRKFWHNIILSLEDGCISYGLDFKEMMSSKVFKIYKDRKLNVEKPVNYIYSTFSDGIDMHETYINIVLPKSEDVYFHIITFLSIMQHGLKSCNKFDFDFINYLDLQRK